MTSLWRFAAAIACLSAGALVSGQQQASPSTPTQTQNPQIPVFRSGVDVVRVDVTALDRNSRPVRRLGAADFTVREAGNPQEIVAFAEVDLPSSSSIPPGWMREVAPDVRRNAIGEGRLIAVFIDDATLPGDPAMIKATKQAAAAVVDELGPSDQAAIIFARAAGASQDFTTDRTLLRAAIERTTAGFLFMGLGSADDHYHHFSSVKTLKELVSYMATVPDRRKAVVYVSIGVLMDLGQASRFTQIGPSGQQAFSDDAQRDLLREMRQAAERPEEAYGLAMRDAFLVAQHSSVTVYAVNPAGPGALEQYLAGYRWKGGTTNVDANRDQVLNRNAYLRTVAEQTGGRAFVGTNDAAGAVRRILDETSSYYLIGYRSTRPSDDRKLRKIEVRVNRPGVTARTRSAVYEASGPVPVLPENAPARLTNALSGIVPKADMALSAVAIPFAERTRAGHTVAVLLGVRQDLNEAAGSAGTEDVVDVVVKAYTILGEPRGSTNQTARVRMRAGERRGDFDVLSRMELPPGRYQLRIAAHSQTTGRSGSVYYDLEVPDFANDRLSMSGVAIAATPSTPAAPADVLKSVLSIVPTTRRSFAQSDVVTALVKIHQEQSRPPVPVVMTASLVGSTGNEEWREQRDIQPTAFGPDGAEYRVDLPLKNLSAGLHLVRIVAKIANREVVRNVILSYGQ